ncbi:hypothetical protein HN51_052472 [Arachis hypogaea]|uniref:Pentatricopeptide repeat-containing protein n=1 Tax=Arachis hypogaea TaxID=3818 RepID=A0A445CAH1_ARAHY|nr:hypothetical protein Ahy_A07g033936 [Arachis hypogaea]
MVSNDSFDDAVLFYNSMHNAGFLPDNYTFTFVLKACAKLADFPFGVKLYSPVKMGFDCDVFVKTSLVCLYSKCGYVKDARKVFDVFLRRMLFCGLLLSLGILGVAFTRKQLLGDLASGEWIDNYITESGFHRNVFVLISSVDMYAKRGSIEKRYASNGLPKEALDLFFEIQMENLRLDCYAMVGVLSACARLGALELENWAKELMDVDEFLLNPVLALP